MYGYIYKTKNKITKEVYIGQKKSNVFVESYYGSGKYIKENLKKYGKANFKVTMLAKADSREELNELEIRYIKKYKDKNHKLCINQAYGGIGGNTFEYATDTDKKDFKDKMTHINQKRCRSQEFKNQTSKRMKKLYSNKSERVKQSERIRKAWSNQDLRSEQSKKLKEYYKNNKKDNSYNNKKCSFELDGNIIIFDSVEKLKSYIKTRYDVQFSNPAFKKMMENETPYIPFHRKKEKLLKLEGMVVRFIDEKV